MIADPHHFDMDFFHPAFHFDVDSNPGPAFHFDADPDPTSQNNADLLEKIQIRKTGTALVLTSHWKFTTRILYKDHAIFFSSLKLNKDFNQGCQIENRTRALLCGMKAR
jgi:hypothetical protein